MDSTERTNWKLKLRSGQLKTAYRHYTSLAEGVAGVLRNGFSCRPGNAIMGMKTWASSTEEASDMIHVIGEQIGFTVTGRVQTFETEPSEPPQEKPHGYSITFEAFDSK